MQARRDPDVEKEPEEVKRGRLFAEVRDHGYTPVVVDRAEADARLIALGMGHLVAPPEQEIDDEMLVRNIFGESAIDEDARLGGWE